MVKIQFAYIRPLFPGQSLTKQICNFIELGIDKENIFCDEIYGEFSEYQKLRSTMQHGDTLYIKSLRVLGRDTIKMVSEWKDIRDNLKVKVNVLENYMMDIGVDRNNIESQQLMKNILDYNFIID
jgi:hypothetical protein